MRFLLAMFALTFTSAACGDASDAALPKLPTSDTPANEGDAGEGEGEGEEGEGEEGEGEGEGEGEDQAPPDSALELRTVDEVCSTWRAFTFSSEPDWVPLGDGSDQCDVGSMPAASQAAAIDRVNVYRWLAGLAPVELAEGLVEQEQHCANALAALGHLSHSLPPDGQCMTPQASSGAASSNLAQGVSATFSVDLFIGDNGVFDLGHRRWVLNPAADVTAFGYKNGFTCMYSFAQGASADPDFVAWPPPGVVPADVAYGRYTFATNRHYASEETAIEVSVDGGDFVVVPFDNLGWGYGSLFTTLAFDVPGLSPWELAGRATRVRISNLSLPDGSLDPNPLEYESRFTACP